jgi:methylthioribose-1-phosphate isomerase
MDNGPLRPPFETVAWTGSAVRILDQRTLPGSVFYRDLETVEEVVEAIRSLAVRGAPAIGVAGAMGIALAAARAAGRPRGEFDALVREAGSLLRASRPTAVNLPWAVDRMLALLDSSPASGGAEMAALLAREAQAVLDEDRRMCARIGEHGASLLGDSTVVLTHCNAGALATGGIGTALAPLFILRSRGRRLRVYVGETRPLWQGARLTAWELRQAGIETIVFPDTAAAWTIRTRSIDCVIVGADRICRNGDVANKIGSYGLALAAGACGVPFYVAAPSSTVDLALASGGGIPIEERSGEEVTRPLGIQLAPEGVGVFNPAFDVVPNGLITAIVTEDGVARPPFEEALAGAVRSRDTAGGRRP